MSPCEESVLGLAIVVVAEVSRRVTSQYYG